MAKSIIVNGEKYPIVEILGYNHSIGHYAWIVKTNEGEKTVVGSIRNARFWTAADRIRPLVEHIERKAREHDL